MSKISNLSKITGYSTIKYVKITDYMTIKYVNVTDNSTITFGWNNVQNSGLQRFLHLFPTFHLQTLLFPLFFSRNFDSVNEP